MNTFDGRYMILNTVSNFQATPSTEATRKVFSQEQVVKVLGKYKTQFDGLEVHRGYLVETAHDGYQVIPFDPGSMANSMNSPEFIEVYWPEENRIPIVTAGSVHKNQY